MKVTQLTRALLEAYRQDREAARKARQEMKQQQSENG